MVNNLECKKIKLTQSEWALVDCDDYDFLSQWKWHSVVNHKTKYAARSVKTNRRVGVITVRMHRAIMNAKHGQMIDHINGNALDNRRQNLRFCTNGQNRQNSKATAGSSKYKGVCWHKRQKMWAANIRYNKILRCLGYFDTEIEAAKAYDAKAVELFGEFARPNFIKIIRDEDGVLRVEGV